jgi:hypothetical protein
VAEEAVEAIRSTEAGEEVEDEAAGTMHSKAKNGPRKRIYWIWANTWTRGSL